MSKVVDDVKTGLKGIRGAGDAIRGEVLEATDRAFDNENHPDTRAAQTKSHVIKDRGKQDMRNVDDMLARREREHGATSGVREPSSTHYSNVTGGPEAPAPAASGGGVRGAI